jgi:hypothetical protein
MSYIVKNISYEAKELLNRLLQSVRWRTFFRELR